MKVKERNPEYFIKQGYIDANDKPVFRRIFEACNIFGHSYKGFQRAGTRHPYLQGVNIWFPKSFVNNAWDNKVTVDEDIIYEKPKNPSDIPSHMKEHIESDYHNRIVFIGEKVEKRLQYRFLGEYLLDVDSSYGESCLVWRRIRARVETYPPKYSK